MTSTTRQLTTVLDGRWAKLRAEIRAQLAEETPVPQGEQREQVLQQLTALARTRVPWLGFPREYGGGGDIGGSLTAFEMLGFGDLSLMVKAGVQWGLFGGAVEMLGTKEHHERYLRDIITLDLLGCFAMTETGHGSDVQHLQTTATYDPDTAEFVIDTPDLLSREDYIGNAAEHGRMAVVFAQLITQGERRGVHALLVPIRTPDGAPMSGVSIGDCGSKGGLNGVDNGRLSFSGVRVPRTALLNRYGDVAQDGSYSSPIENDDKRFFTMLGALIRGRISVAGSAGSATKRALTIAVRYAQRRRQFTRPSDGEEVVLLDYLAQQRKLLPALATSYGLHFAQEELVAALHEIQTSSDVEQRRQRELESRAAGIKALTTWHATETIQRCRESCGGAGYLDENLLTTLKADTDVFTTFEGDNTVLLQLVAKSLLTNYQHDFADLGTLATAKVIAEHFVSEVAEHTVARSLIERLLESAPGKDSEDVLLDRAWQLKTFTDREQHVLDGLARRMRRVTDESADAFTVFNQAQDHVLRAGRVHIERLVLEAFIAAIDRCTEEEPRALLTKVCDLHVLSAIEHDLAWFLGHDRITPARAKAVTSTVNTLSAELRPHASTLVDAFAIPERYLDAAILREHA